ncbi:MAG TPA: TIM barrel protein [Bryobacteraceae bacterium]|nr:TIM barrel protein [Bryobacteraceae bacterium]
MNRRIFLQTAAGAVLVQGAGFAQTAKSLGSGIRLGFDTYSVRAFNWKDIQLLDFAASLKVDTIQISDSADYASREPAHLARVKAHAEQLGIEIDSGIGCICPIAKGWKETGKTPQQVITDGLRIGQAVGARAMRCVMGGVDDRRAGRPIEELMETTIKVFRSVKAQAQDLNVKIAIENHGDMTARETRTVIEESGKDFVASCLDTGNPVSVMEHPQTTLEVLGPYAVTTHVRDSVVFEHPRGAAAQWVALGDGAVDWTAFLTLYQQVCPKALLQLEIITGRPPQVLPYLEKEWWSRFQNMPARDFARFVALANKGGPFMGSMVIEDSPGEKPAEYKAALKEQQRFDLARSITYAQRELGLGMNWKR